LPYAESFEKPRQFGVFGIAEIQVNKNTSMAPLEQTRRTKSSRSRLPKMHQQPAHQLLLSTQLLRHINICTSTLNKSNLPQVDGEGFGGADAESTLGQQLFCIAQFPDVKVIVDLFANQARGSTMMLGTGANNSNTASVFAVEGDLQNFRIATKNLHRHCNNCPIVLRHLQLTVESVKSALCNNGTIDVLSIDPSSSTKTEIFSELLTCRIRILVVASVNFSNTFARWFRKRQKHFREFKRIGTWPSNYNFGKQYTPRDSFHYREHSVFVNDAQVERSYH